MTWYVEDLNEQPVKSNKINKILQLVCYGFFYIRKGKLLISGQNEILLLQRHIKVKYIDSILN